LCASCTRSLASFTHRSCASCTCRSLHHARIDRVHTAHFISCTLHASIMCTVHAPIALENRLDRAIWSLVHDAAICSRYSHHTLASYALVAHRDHPRRRIERLAHRRVHSARTARSLVALDHSMRASCTRVASYLVARADTHRALTTSIQRALAIDRANPARPPITTRGPCPGTYALWRRYTHVGRRRSVSMEFDTARQVSDMSPDPRDKTRTPALSVEHGGSRAWWLLEDASS
jgi:hypothetical protein